MNGALLIKEVIAMYDNKNVKMGLTKMQVDHNHAIICDFFAFVIDQDIEIQFKDKRATPNLN